MTEHDYRANAQKASESGTLMAGFRHISSAPELGLGALRAMFG